MTILNPTKIVGTVTGLFANGSKADESLGTHPLRRVNAVFGGLAEDRHAGLTSKADVRFRRQYKEGTEIANTRQISILSVEELAEIQAAMDLPALDPGWVGANMTVEGIPQFTQLSPSTRLLFSSGAALVIDNENRPCRYPGDEIEERHPGKGRSFVKAATGRRGVVAWVEREGSISLGDSIAVHLPPQRLYPMG